MAPNRKVVVVTGATGTQGSGVVQVCIYMRMHSYPCVAASSLAYE